MSSQGVLPSIEKLKGCSNYANWKFAMELYLMHEDLWECVENDKDEESANKDETKDKKARAKICLMVAPHVYVHVRNTKTAKEAWENLRKAYEDKGLCRRLSLLRKLFNLKYVQFSSMEDYVKSKISTSQCLTDIGSALDDEFVAVIMLSGLPTEFNPMVMALENSGAKITSDLIKAKLLQENIQNSEEREEYESTNKALVTKNKYFRKNVKCFKCHKLGHFAGNCPTNNFQAGSSNSRQQKKTGKGGNKSLFSAFSTFTDSESWYVDSGATVHMTNQRHWIDEFTTENSHKEISLADNKRLISSGSGIVKVKLANEESITNIEEVIYVEKLATNLLSVNKLTEKGLCVVFSDNGCKIYDEECIVEGNIIATASKCEGLYKFDAEVYKKSEKGFVSEIEKTFDHHENALVSSTKQSHELWHKRLGHLNRISMKLLKNKMADGINFEESSKYDCISCIEGKQTRLPFPKGNVKRAKQKLDLVHSDICGPMEKISHGGAKYLLTFTDDFSRKTFPYFLRHKSEALEKFKEFKALVENEAEKKIKILRTDNGREYVNNVFKNFLMSNGIKHQHTVPYSPEQNGVAERANRTIIEKARSMLQEAGLEKSYWAEAVNMAVYLKNRSPTKVIQGKTPEEEWSNKRINLSHLKVFGCIAYCHVPDVRRKKFDPKSKKYIFVGYSEDSKGYRLIDPRFPKKIIISRDVIFLEDTFLKKTSESKTRIEEEIPIFEILNSEIGISTADSYSDGSNQEMSSQSEIINSESTAAIVNQEEIVEIDTSIGEQEERYPLRSRIKMRAQECGFIANLNTPVTVTEALTSNENMKWKQAMLEEYEALIKNGTWELVDLPKDKKVVANKWVFKIKTDEDGNVERFKARLVAKGYTQQYGVDYEETFSPVIRYSTLRLLLAMAAKLNLEIDHMDVATAFLNGELQEEVYMQQPEYFVVIGKETKVCRMKKALYGLKQSSRAWNQKINYVLLKMGFQRSNLEPCVYSRRENNKLLIIALYVDDILLFSNNKEEKIKFKQKITSMFEMKDLGKAKYFLGMRINQDERGITIDQTKYIENILDKFKMSNCKPVDTPLAAGTKFVKKETDNNTNLPYQELVGCLMYLSVCSRPDICHVASILSQFNTCFDENHFQSAKRVLRYLKGTKDMALRYERSSQDEITGCVDADWAGNELDRKSYTGYVFTLANGAICWESKKQRTVALSSAEAEYMGLTEAAKEAKFLKSTMKEIFDNDIGAIKLYNDSQSAQQLVENQRFHKRSKHIDIRYHFVREAVQNREIELMYVPTEDMTADILTKGLHKPKHKKCCEELGFK